MNRVSFTNALGAIPKRTNRIKKKMKEHRISRLTILVISLIMIYSNSFCQVSVYDVSLDSIKQFTIENSEYLIQLNEKTIHPDSIITVPEIFNLYYGSAYLEGYSPYIERASAVIPYELLQQEKYIEAIDICKSQILSNPGFIRPFYFLGIAYKNLGDTITANKFFDRFYDYLRIPYNSGTGESADKAFVVRSIDDEYLIVGELGLETESQALIFVKDMPYDILYINTINDTVPKEMYFNISQPYLIGLGKNSEKEEE